VLVQLEHALADVHAQIPHALEVGHELERHGDEAQVGRDRLAPREHAKALVVDLDLEPVDLAVELDRLLRQVAVALHERADAALEHLLDLGPHQEELLVDLAELRLVLAVGVLPRHQPNLPVM
jgi:predicted HD phosphohydrolase